MTNLGALHVYRKCLHICNCLRRSLSAATDAIGFYVFSMPCTNCQCLPEIATSASGLLAMTNLGGHCLFNIGPHFPPVRCREGHAPPLQRMTGGLVKFSTFQFHFLRAAPLHMCYPILQKGLLRGSCSRPFAPREGNRRYQRWTTVPASPRTAAPACASEAMMACPPVFANETAALTFGSMEPGAKWPSSQ